MRSLSVLDEMSLLLRPAGGSIYPASVSASSEQLTIQRCVYGAESRDRVASLHQKALADIADSALVIMGIPSDVGAGYRRGANLAPQAMRSTLVKAEPEWHSLLRDLGAVDIGDVIAIPQLHHDTMVSEEQLAYAREALYPDVSAATREALPVSPLSIAERVLDLVYAVNPKVRIFVIGGDHSTAWPIVSGLAKNLQARWGIVQVDAHPDLAESRAGVKLCYSTWARHANRLLSEDGRLIQVGIRQTRFDPSHWRKTCNVMQYLASACSEHPQDVLDRVVSQLRDHMVTDVFLSNDIDGTDPSFASATGTPVPGGLHPEFVVALIRRLGAEFNLVAADLMELAPDLEDSPEAGRTLAIASMYMRESLAAMLGPSVRV